MSKKSNIIPASAQSKSLPEIDRGPMSNPGSSNFLVYAFLARFSALRTEIFVGATKISVFC